MSGLPSWDTVCVIFSGGEFAHSPPFLIALWAGSHTVVPCPTRYRFCVRNREIFEGLVVR